MNILCPIDFSEHSLYALQYAVDLANKTNSKLHVFTAYSVPRSTGRLRSLDNDIRAAVSEDLAEVVKQITPRITSGQETSYHVMEGNSGRAINEFAKAHNMDLIIMGTQGKGSISNMFLGSVAKKVVDNSAIPVIAVPQNVKVDADQGLAILNLDEKEIANESVVEFIRNFTQKLSLQLEVYHLVTPGTITDMYRDSVKKLGDVVKSVITENSDNITQSIKNHAETTNSSLIIMIRRPHSFWSRLFLDSKTTTELAMTNVPIMILPE